MLGIKGKISSLNLVLISVLIVIVIGIIVFWGREEKEELAPKKTELKEEVVEPEYIPTQVEIYKEAERLIERKGQTAEEIREKEEEEKLQEFYLKDLPLDTLSPDFDPKGFESEEEERSKKISIKERSETAVKEKGSQEESPEQAQTIEVTPSVHDMKELKSRGLILF